MKLKKYYLLTFILISICLLAAVFVIRADVAFAEGKATPKYTLLFNYTEITRRDNGNEQNSGNGTQVQKYYKSGQAGTVEFLFWGETANDVTSTFYPGNYITSNNIHIQVILEDGGETGTLKLKNSAGAEVFSQNCQGANMSKVRTTIFMTTLSDGTYTMEFTASWYRMGDAATRILTATTSFVIDSAPPEINLSCGDNDFSNNDVSVTYSDTTSGVALAKYSLSTAGSYPSSTTIAFTSGTVFTEEGNYTIEVHDYAGNMTVKRFTIDKTAPTLSLTGVSNGNYTSGDIWATWSTEIGGVNSNCMNANDVVSVKYSYGTSSFPESASTTYAEGTPVYDEGYYLMVISDSAGNSNSYTFVIDKTAPIGTLSGVTNGGYTNGNVTFSWTDGEAAATLNGSGYSLGATVSTEGAYTIVLTDLAGNSNSYTFVIDKTAPIGTLSGVANGGYTNGNVTFSWTDGEASATLNGSGYSSGATVSTESAYTIVLTDLAGNSNSYTFVIDKTAPVGTLSGVANGGYTNGNVTFSWTDGEASATLNGSGYSSGATVSTEGAYTIVLIDLAGNSNSYAFVIDKTAPIGTLSGVANGGYTNGNVTFSWTDGEASATLNGSNYSSGATISSENKYTLVLTDLARNSTAYTFTIDKTAPVGTFSGVANGGYTNGNVTFSWTDGEASATLNGNGYSSGATVSTEGAYTVVLTDFAMNSNTYSFTIDRTAPIIEMPIERGEHTGKDVVITFYDLLSGVTALYGKSENLLYPAATVAFASGYKFVDESYYTVKVTDFAGNYTETNFTIDKSAPVINDFSPYTNKAFTMTAQDKYGEIGAWEYRFNSGDIQRYQGQALTIGNGAESNGEWALRVIDELGNTSKWVTVKYVFRETFGNFDSIYNSFFVPSYFTVTLSQKYYVNCFGTYSFADYESAHSFAVNKEWECRVISLEDGSSWNYVNPTNENTRQIYTDRTELESVIDKYARKNISDRKVVGKHGTVLNNPTDAFGNTQPGALTSQIAVLPELLSGYSEYRYMLAQPTYSLVTPQSVVDGNRSTATIQFVSDGITLREGAVMPLEYGVSLIDALSAVSEQGWYLITESDVCGNIEKYLIFIDLQQPDILADVVYGNGSAEKVNFNREYIDGNIAAMRYVSFKIDRLSDNIDGFSMLSIEGRNAGGRYVWGDEIPVLSYENGYYGAYTITAYDRSHNAIDFVVYIAGEDPSLRHTSLTNETLCTFTIQINDSYNEITEIKLFKIHFDGSEEVIYADNYDTPVNAQNLVYRMNVGGKYVFEFSDLYGRTVRTSPIFYMKGLPSATLRGVKDGGLTKNDVSIVYDADNTCELYTFSGGEWYYTDRYEITQGISSYTIGITASIETTAIYKILLYKTADRNLFTEYTFEIDGIPPAAGIYTGSGSEIMPETVTTQDFFVTWQESGYKAYYKKQGALSENSYSKDTLISADGNYVFTIYDIARNELTFSVTLDKMLSYTLQGTYTLLEDGSYITRNYFTFTVVEPYSEFVVNASNGLSVVNGQKLDTDGTYMISATDIYGNTAALTLIVDKLPPVPIIVAEDREQLEDGARTSKSFRVYCEENNVSITYARNNDGSVAYDGTLLNEPGKYTFRISDRVGNAKTVTITIDREVTYRIDGNYSVINGAFCSRTWLLVVPTETVLKFGIITEDGRLIDVTKRISEEGVYTVDIVDIAENSVRFTIIIDKTAPYVQAVTQAGNQLIGVNLTNQNFKFECLEEDAVVAYSFNDSEFMYTGEWLTEPGKYSYVATDRLGNTSTGEIIIDIEVSISIDGNYEIFDGVYYSRNWILLTPMERVTVFTVEDADGNFLDNGKRISSEGKYKATVTDVAGNCLVLEIVIDKTAPFAQVLTESGKKLSGGAVNELFKLVCDEDNVITEYVFNGGKFSVYSGEWLDGAGLYTFKSTDRIGNTSETSVLLNYDVSFSVEGDFMFVDGKYYSKSWLLVSPQEAYSEFIIEDANAHLIDTTKRITEEGNYAVTITDLAGNKLCFEIVIDKTAPEIIAETVSGKILVNGSTTNENFNIKCTEQNSVLKYKYNASEILPYTDELLSEPGRYVITVSDFLGNSADCGIVIDKEVSLSIGGTYVIDGENFISRNWLSVTPNEELQEFYIADVGGAYYDTSTRLTIEGVYTVYAKDIYGNEINLRLVIDNTAPVIKLNGVIAGESTNSRVSANFVDYSEAYYRFNNGDNIMISSGAEFEQEGIYLITVKDIVGNTATVAFTIDKHVDVVSSIKLENGYIITSAVSFKFNEEVTAKLYCAGTETAYVRGEIAAPGKYSLYIVDSCGNEKAYEWVIVPVKARSYSLPINQGTEFAVNYNGYVITLPVNNNELSLTETGKYSISFVNGSANWITEIEVDNIAPEVQFENTGKSVKISNPNKDNLSYTLYCNGERMSFSLKSVAELTKTGDYLLVCEDDVGNVTEYTFSLNYLSGVSIALIAVVAVLALTGIVTVITFRLMKKIY